MDILCSYDRPSPLPIPSPSTRIPPYPFTHHSDCWTIKANSKNMQNEGFSLWVCEMTGTKTWWEAGKRSSHLSKKRQWNSAWSSQTEKKEQALFLLFFYFYFLVVFSPPKNNTECLTVRLHDLLWDTDHIPINLDLRNDGPWWVHREEWINVHVND